MNTPLSKTAMPPLRIQHLGNIPYREAWEKMKAFTDTRDADTPDEIWCLEHPPVFTQGQAGKPEHVFQPGEIEVVQSDRGGQITYHGPGQLIVYTLIDLKRRNLGIRKLVSALENSVIELLKNLDISSCSRCDAPGVYVDDKKIASVGLRVRRGCSYHGLALNVSMDLEPFSRIRPCGLEGIAMTQLSDFSVVQNVENVIPRLLPLLKTQLGYTAPFE